MTPKYTSPSNRDEFNLQVWEIVNQIPAGKVSTYGQIAAMIPPPSGVTPESYKAFGARWVGGAMAACPPGVPWQRVINSQGKISLRKREGQNVQQELLEEEGVEFDDRQRVNLSRYGWSGPPQDWLKERGLNPPPTSGKPYQTEMPF